MTAAGAADGTTGSKQSRDKFGDAFLNEIATTNPDLGQRWGSKWAEVPESEACTNEIMEYVATYAATIYIIPAGRVNAGTHLSQDSAENYWGGMIDDRFKQFQHGTVQTTLVREPRA